MRTLQMYPKDITVVCEFTATDLLKIRKAMDLIEVQYNKDNPGEVEAKDFLTMDFMDWLDSTLKEVMDA